MPLEVMLPNLVFLISRPLASLAPGMAMGMIQPGSTLKTVPKTSWMRRLPRSTRPLWRFLEPLIFSNWRSLPVKTFLRSRPW